MQDVGLADAVAAPAVASCYVLYRSADAREAACVNESLTGGHVGFRSCTAPEYTDSPTSADVSRDALDVTDRSRRCSSACRGSRPGATRRRARG